MGKKAVSYLMFCLAVAVTALFLVAAVMSLRASYMPPQAGDFWSVLALMLPVILVLNGVLLVVWLVRRHWLVALLPLAAFAININYISATVQLPDIGHAEGPVELRIGTLNVNGFNYLGDRATAVYGISATAAREGLDVLCMQEFLDDHIVTSDSIGTYFTRMMPYYVHDSGQAIVSRYPILKHHHTLFEQTNNDYMWADLLVGADTVRIFSVHLQTSGISALRHRFGKENRSVPMEVVLQELERNSHQRAEQVELIRAQIAASPHPVVLVGDFNDTPSSYTYRRIKGDLTDGFRACGNGYGGTYRYMGGVLRIDYIFYDDTFSGVRYYMPQEEISDHKLVIAELARKR